MSKKNKLLILSLVLMLIISYQFALKNTFEVYNDYSNNLAKKEQVGNIPKQLALLAQKEKVMDGQLHELNLEDSSVQSNLLKFLNKQAELNDVKIIDFNSPHTYEDENQEIETFIFDLEGSYAAILKTINALENNGSFGAVVHFQMEKMKNYRTKRTYLQAKVFLEQIR